ncbi:YcfL family protein [Pelagicoccus enzymogenes]|uniref:YcfL family protein n=1 Tax=Pelagicoccus enzymogenes TaxID=2773457 RepID=UPI00280D9C15|nr:YcfL family protein [Pelagicoccus enzymogenes]MDQ8196745.1 YcfL family protein [Pelagicoccus enzymogenes]
MKSILITLTTAFALLLAGCESTGVNTVSSATGGTDYAWYTPDSDTRKHVFVESVNTAKTEGGITKVQVVLKNKGGKARAFNYKFEWQDANGFAVRSATSTMKTVRLMPQETITITGIAPNPKAEGYTLKLVKTT